MADAAKRHRTSTFGNVRKLTSGRFQASYYHRGERHVAPNTFLSKADARAWLSVSQAQILGGEWREPKASRITVAELAEAWREANPRKRNSSRARDASIIENHILPALGAKVLDRVTRHDIQSLVDRWSLTHEASTVGRQYSTLRAMFSFAVDSERLGRSPCVRIRLPQSKLVERPQLSVAQLETLEEELGPLHGVMMWTGPVLTLRWAEAAGLTASSIDTGTGVVRITQQLARSGTLEPLKSATSLRTLSCADWLLQDLAELAARCTKADTLLFNSPGGAALHYTNWRRRVWNPACERAGVPGLRFHDLRSLAATTLIAAGVDVKTAQSRLGHSSSKVTLDLYARATVDADRQAAVVVGELLRPSRTNRARRPAGARSLEPVTPLHQDEPGGASWNRTSDLSIISAAL